MLSLVALPLIVASTREGLNSIPRHVREASYAVGKTKAATTRRILLPTCRPQVATGAMLGLGRIIGDTAIIVVLLGATQNFAPVEGAALPVQLPARRRHHPDQLRLRGLPHREPQPAGESLRGGFRPAADGPGPERGRRRRPPPRPKGRNVEPLTSPPPIRRLKLEDPEPATEVAAAGHRRATATARSRAASPPPSARSARPSSRSGGWRSTRSRSHYGDQRGGQRRLAAGPPGRGAVADRPLGLRQDDAAALAQPAHRADQHGARSAAASCSTTSTSPRSSRPCCGAG